MLTELCDICQTLDIRLLEKLELFWGQSSLCVVLADGWSRVLSGQPAVRWLVAGLTLLCSKVVVCTKVQSARDWWCVLVSLLSQWAARRLVEDGVVGVARAAAVGGLIVAFAWRQWNAAALWTVELEWASAIGIGGRVKLHRVVEGGWEVESSRRVAVLARAPLRGGDRRSEVVPNRRARTIVVVGIVLARASMKRRWGRWHAVVAILAWRAGKQVRHEARHGEASGGAVGRKWSVQLRGTGTRWEPLFVRWCCLLQKVL